MNFELKKEEKDKIKEKIDKLLNEVLPDFDKEEQKPLFY